MKSWLLLVLALLCVSCASPAPEKRGAFFEVTGFHTGKMRQENGRWEIYQPGGDMRYEVNGACEYDGAAYPCMWYGWVINYETNQEEVVLQCAASASDRIDWGNAEQTSSEQAMQFDFTLTFRGGQTEKRTPNYIIASNGETAPDRTRFVCRHGGRTVLSYTLTVTYQDDDEFAGNGQASLARSLTQ